MDAPANDDKHAALAAFVTLGGGALTLDAALAGITGVERRRSIIISRFTWPHLVSGRSGRPGLSQLVV